MYWTSSVWYVVRDAALSAVDIAAEYAGECFRIADMWTFECRADWSEQTLQYSVTDLIHGCSGYQVCR